jgi:hypothetical protein
MWIAATREAAWTAKKQAQTTDSATCKTAQLLDFEQNTENIQRCTYNVQVAKELQSHGGQQA